MPTRDDLMSNIEGYFSKISSVQNIAAQQTSGATQERYLEQGKPGMAAQTLVAANKLNTVLKDTNKKYKEAVDFQIKANKVAMRFVTITQAHALKNEIKILNIMKEQYKVQERHVKLEALSNKMAGRYATKMMKSAITGKNELGEEVGGRGKRAAMLAGGGMIAALQGTYNFMLFATMKFVTALKTAWDGGIAGVMQVAVGAISGLVNLVAPGLGAALGAIGELFIKIAMMRWEDQIARTTMGVRAAALGGGSGEKLFSDMLSVTKGVRALAVEWGNALVDVTTNTSTEVADTFYRFGKTYALSAQQTSDYMNQALVSGGEDAVKAGTNLTKVFEASKEMAKKSGINARFFTAAIMDAAVSARMFNVDIKSVANSMKDLSDNAGAMAGFGYSLRNNKQTINDLATAPKNWSTSLHAFAGMKMFKDMKPTQAALASMYGEGTARSIRQKEEGKFGFTSDGGGGEAGLMQNRIKMMTTTIGEATAGMTDPSDKYFTGLQMLSDLFGVSGTAATAILAGVGQGKGEILPDDVKNALLTEKQISEKLLTTSDRQEQIQRIIMEIAGRLIGLVVLLPDKLANLLTKGLFGKEGAAAFDEVLGNLGKNIEQIGKTAGLKNLVAPIVEGIAIAEKAKMKQIYKTPESFKKMYDEKKEELKRYIDLDNKTKLPEGDIRKVKHMQVSPEFLQQKSQDLINMKEKGEGLFPNIKLGSNTKTGAGNTYNFYGYHDRDLLDAVQRGMLPA